LACPSPCHSIILTARVKIHRGHAQVLRPAASLQHFYLAAAHSIQHGMLSHEYYLLSFEHNLEHEGHNLISTEHVLPYVQSDLLPLEHKERGHLRHWATTRKVAGSIPYDVIGIFYSQNSSGLTLLPLQHKERGHLRHWTKTRKVTGSIPYGVTGIFHSRNSSGRTMAMGSIQTLTWMSTMDIFWG